MAENLLAADVEAYTKGRLPDDESTELILAQALAAARRYCEWHVSPVLANHVKTLDGPGVRSLMLPTMRLVTLHSVVEDGVAVPVNTLRASAGGPVRLRKTRGGRWSNDYSSIVVTMTHGYAAADAADWRLGILDACDRFSKMLGVSGLKRHHVDDIDREWFDRSDEAFNTRLLEPFRLIAPE